MPSSATTAQKPFFTGIPTLRTLSVALSPWQVCLFFARREFSTALRLLEKQFRERLESLRTIAIVGDVRGIGAVAAIELERTGGYFDEIGPRLYDAFLRRGLLLRPLGSILYFMPPYAITEQEVDWAFDQIADVLREVDAV